MGEVEPIVFFDSGFQRACWFSKQNAHKVVISADVCLWYFLNEFQAIKATEHVCTNKSKPKACRRDFNTIRKAKNALSQCSESVFDMVDIVERLIHLETEVRFCGCVAYYFIIYRELGKI